MLLLTLVLGNFPTSQLPYHQIVFSPQSNEELQDAVDACVELVLPSPDPHETTIPEGENYNCVPLFNRELDDRNSTNLKEPKWKREKSGPDIKGIFFADFDRTISMLHTFNIMHRRGIRPQNLTDDEVLDMFGGIERVRKLDSFFASLALRGVVTIVVSFGDADDIYTLMNRVELIGQRMSSLTDIMSTNGLVELCGSLDPGFGYDKAKCIFGRYENLLGAELNKVGSERSNVKYMFADDSMGNINHVRDALGFTDEQVCRVSKWKGISQSNMESIISYFDPNGAPVECCC